MRRDTFGSLSLRTAAGSFRSQIGDLKSNAEGISRQLRAWCNSLQNSDIRGQRYLNEKARKAARAREEREEALKEFRAVQLENIRRTKARALEMSGAKSTTFEGDELRENEG